jgi:hypothetical protein
LYIVSKMKSRKINIHNYRCGNESANYLSMGCKKDCMHANSKVNVCAIAGKFDLDQEELFDFIAKTRNDQEGWQWCFVERRSEYFILFFDFDVDKYLPNKENVDVSAFTQYLIDNLTKSLEHYIIMNETKDESQYIFSDRDDKSNFHLYFLNIILNSKQALAIRNKMIELIMLDNKYNLTVETYNNIIDKSIYGSAGMKHLFQRKPHEEGYYKINKEKSTYKKIPEGDISQLQITSIRTLNKDINVNLQLNEDGCPILMQEIELQDQKKVSIAKPIITPNLKKKPTVPIFKMNNKEDEPGRDNDTDIQNDKNTVKSIESEIDNEFDISNNPESALKLDVPEEMIKDLFDNLKSLRFDKFEDWIKIMYFCLNYGLKGMAHYVSKKCPKKYNKNQIN